jgi:hypothetical protein
MSDVISIGMGDESQNPSIALDDLGNIHIVWQDLTDYNGSGGDWDIFYSYFNKSNNEWGDIEVVSTESTATSALPWIAVDVSGNIHVSWQDDMDYNGSGSDYDIFYKFKNVTTKSWKTTEVVSNESTQNSLNPTIAVDSFGNGHVAWCDYTDYNGSGTDSDIFYKYRNLTSYNWTLSEIVSNESTSESVLPTITLDNFSNIHIAWHDNSSYAGAGTDYDIFYKFFNSTLENWTITEVVSNESSGFSSQSSILSDIYGNIHCLWADNTPNYKSSGADYDIFYSSRNVTSGNWSIIELVSNESDAGSNSPSIGIDSIGNIYATWNDVSNYTGAGVDFDIFIKMRNVTTANWTITTVVSSESDENSRRPKLAVDSAGTIHITWRDLSNYSGSGTDEDIFYKKVFSNNNPYINHPSDIITTLTGVESIGWILYDDYGGGQYRIRTNDTSGVYYTWKDWTSWINTTPLNIVINRSFPGTFNYTIEYNDIYNLSGIVDTVIVIISPASAPPDDFLLYFILIFIIIGVGVIIGVGFTVKKRKKKLIPSDIREESEELSIKISPTIPPSQPPVMKMPKKAEKLVKEDDIGKIMGLTSEEKRELKRTEAEVSVKKKQFICVVHKGHIEGDNYLCPNCQTFYCVKCAQALKDKGEKCWSCGNEINVAKTKVEVQERIKELEIKMESLKSAVKKLDETFYAGAIEQEEYSQMKDSLTQKVTILLIEIKRLKE